MRDIQPGQSIGIFIGPEGGFEEKEVETAISEGAKPITLGKRILRTETAGLAILSVLMFQLENNTINKRGVLWKFILIILQRPDAMIL